MSDEDDLYTYNQTQKDYQASLDHAQTFWTDPAKHWEDEARINRGREIHNERELHKYNSPEDSGDSTNSLLTGLAVASLFSSSSSSASSASITASPYTSTYSGRSSRSQASNHQVDGTSLLKVTAAIIGAGLVISLISRCADQAQVVESNRVATERMQRAEEERRQYKLAYPDITKQTRYATFAKSIHSNWNTPRGICSVDITKGTFAYVMTYGAARTEVLVPSLPKPCNKIPGYVDTDVLTPKPNTAEGPNNDQPLPQMHSRTPTATRATKPSAETWAPITHDTHFVANTKTITLETYKPNGSRHTLTPDTRFILKRIEKEEAIITSYFPLTKYGIKAEQEIRVPKSFLRSDDNPPKNQESQTPEKRTQDATPPQKKITSSIQDGFSVRVSFPIRRDEPYRKVISTAFTPYVLV